MATYSAKNARVTFNAVAFTAIKWTATIEGDELETTNFESGGLHEAIIGIRKCTFSISANDDNGTTTLDRIVPGLYTSAGVIKLYLNAPAAGVGPYIQINTPLIKSVQYDADVKNPMAVQIQGVGSGTYVHATGAAGATT